MVRMRFCTTFFIPVLMLFLSGISAFAQKPVNIIMDSDMAGDADDVGDQAMLWALAKNGEINVLALVTSSTNDYSAPAVKAIAKYYGHSNVLIGAYHGNIPNDYHNSNSYFAEELASKFGTPGETRANYPDAVAVYRQALAGAQDGSVLVVSGGFYQPLMALLQSPADSISPLTGTQLVTQKVKMLVTASGSYPSSGSSASNNFAADPGGASYVAANWPTPVVWVDDNAGGPSNMYTGPAANASESANPIKLAYDLQCGNGQWCPNALPAWTQAALLFAARGLQSNFTVGGKNGTVTINSTSGTDGWSTATKGKHSYIERVADVLVLQNILNGLIQAPPQ